MANILSLDSTDLKRIKGLLFKKWTVTRSMKFKFNETRNNKIVSFSSVLPSVISRFDIGEQYLIASLQAVWHEIVGDLVATHSIQSNYITGYVWCWRIIRVCK